MEGLLSGLPLTEEKGELWISGDLVKSPDHKLAGVTTLDFDGLLPQSLKLQEDLSEGCGGQIWPAGIVLARYMLERHMHDLKDKTIVELGAGGGLVGLTVALGCNPTRAVFITDQKPMILLMEQNIALNGLEDRVKPRVLDWGSTGLRDVPSHPDIILAADCVYFEPAFPLLERTLLDLIGANTIVYFCFKKRRKADMKFIKAIKKRFRVDEIADAPGCDIFRRDGIFLYSIRRRDAA